ncbi:MAG: UvrB/UvrC motif-containing protein, partial [Sphingomonadaceae bacterium]|nr:UvrB/UvrC motif-containing protein [Sphingomonadaceae bacterium]
SAAGRFTLSAHTIPGASARALAVPDRRRAKQVAYNEAHGITPQTIRKTIGDIIAHVTDKADRVTVEIDEETPHLVGHNLKAYIAELEEKMKAAAADLEFETAARIRDEIRKLEASELGLPADLQVARPKGRAMEGRPGTRKTRFGKTRPRRMG